MRRKGLTESGMLDFVCHMQTLTLCVKEKAGATARDVRAVESGLRATYEGARTVPHRDTGIAGRDTAMGREL